MRLWRDEPEGVTQRLDKVVAAMTLGDEILKQARMTSAAKKSGDVFSVMAIYTPWRVDAPALEIRLTDGAQFYGVEFVSHRWRLFRFKKLEG